MSNDTFRNEHRFLNEEEKESIRVIKARASELLMHIEQAPTTDQRRIAVARTKLEEVVMWATKAITG